MQPRRSRSRAEPLPGFSLPELLVVIAIIGLVVALIVPTISALRNRSRVMRCITNQRTITLANYAYATDNNGRWTSPRTDDNGAVFPDVPFNGSGSTESKLKHTWVNSQDPHIVYDAQSRPRFEKTSALETGVLFPYVGEVLCYVSPNEPTNQYLSAVSSDATRVRSYSFNGCLGVTRPDELPSYDVPFNSSAGPNQFATPLSAFNTTTIATIKQPQRMLSTLVEDDSVNYNNQGWVVLPQEPRWVDWPACWDPKSITMTYVDGSTETYELKVLGLKAYWDQATVNDPRHNLLQPTGAPQPNNPNDLNDPQSLDWRYFRDRLNPGVLRNSTMGFGN